MPPFLLAFSSLCFSSFLCPTAHALFSLNISSPVAVNTHSSSDTGLDGAPALAYFPAGLWAGRVVCTWLGEEVIPGYAGKNIFSAYSDNHGSSWSPALLLSDYGAGNEGLQEGLPKIDVSQQCCPASFFFCCSCFMYSAQTPYPSALYCYFS